MALDLADIVSHWGLLAVLGGTIAEGETVVILGGLFAHRGYLDVAAVWLAAATGGFIGDQCWFWAGRSSGPRVLARLPKLAAAVARADPWISGHPMAAAFGVRFIYGMRTAGPVALGVTTMPAGRFALANLVGAATWAAIFTGLGWFFGEAAERWLGDLKRHEGWIAAAIAVCGALVWLAWRAGLFSGRSSRTPAG